MPREIDWTDSEEIGILLQEKYPEMEPYSVRFTDLHKYVTGLWEIRLSRMRGFWRRSRRPGTKSMRTRNKEPHAGPACSGYAGENLTEEL